MQILLESLQLIFVVSVLSQDLETKANALYVVELWNGPSYRLKMIDISNFV